MLELGQRVKFFPATALVQLLQQAKLQLQLQPLLVKLDRYDLIVVDDLGYLRSCTSVNKGLPKGQKDEKKGVVILSNGRLWKPSLRTPNC
jgi:hypothetical protein